MFLVFNKCCCCIDLRTGSFIIGYLNLIIILIVIALNVVSIIMSKEELSSMWTSTQEQDCTVFVVSCVMTVLLAVTLIFIIVLLVGLHKEKRGHVKAYLIFAIIFGLVYIPQLVALIILAHIPVWRIIIEASNLILNAYFFLCLKSYYSRMGGSSKRPTIYNMGMD